MSKLCSRSSNEGNVSDPAAPCAQMQCSKHEAEVGTVAHVPPHVLLSDSLGTAYAEK